MRVTLIVFFISACVTAGALAAGADAPRDSAVVNVSVVAAIIAVLIAIGLSLRAGANVLIDDRLRNEKSPLQKEIADFLNSKGSPLHEHCEDPNAHLTVRDQLFASMRREIIEQTRQSNEHVANLLSSSSDTHTVINDRVGDLVRRVEMLERLLLAAKGTS